MPDYSKALEQSGQTTQQCSPEVNTLFQCFVNAGKVRHALLTGCVEKVVGVLQALQAVSMLLALALDLSMLQLHAQTHTSAQLQTDACPQLCI